MDEALSHSIVAAVKGLATSIAPNLQFHRKYGGEVFVPDAAHPNKFVGGVFAYKDHVSLEFSDGATLDDPSGHLEGKGKARRHLKLRSVHDIEAKDAVAYLRQTLQ
ncbi:MAG TPA: DUF1801 domain-containing protein [Roseibacterium sp.]|nr:DUF1801 domain-containing protein [Roseibacterium sp.]